MRLHDHRETGRRNLLAMFDTRQGWQAGTLLPGFVLVIMAAWLILGWLELSGNGRTAISMDFRVFWAAARLAVEGNPLEAFNVEALARVHEIDEQGDWMPWAYPPAFLVALMPLGALSFANGWVVFTLLSMAAMFAASRPFSETSLPAWLSLAFAPAALPTLLMGQTSLFWAAGLLAALACLRNGQQVAAGIFIGLLTLKPQLGILIPIALIAMGAWRTVIAATLTTIAISLAATAVVGWEYWSDMRQMMHLHFEVVSSQITENWLMVSPFAAFAGLGLPGPLALALQWAMTATAAVMVGLAFYSPRVSFDLAAACLFMGVIMSSPYLWYYEAALLAPAALFMIRAGVLGPTPFGIALALAMWLSLGPIILIQFLTTDIDAPFRATASIISFIAFFTCLNALITCLRRPEAAAA